MKNQETIQGNKLIAEFMGAPGDLHWLPQHREPCIFQGALQDYDEHFRSDELKYHLSWDWLMPVVERIESLSFQTFIGLADDGSQKFKVVKGEYHKDVTGCPVWDDAKIQATWRGVVNFIEWYSKIK